MNQILFYKKWKQTTQRVGKAQNLSKKWYDNNEIFDLYFQTVQRLFVVSHKINGQAISFICSSTYENIDDVSRESNGIGINTLVKGAHQALE